jgi:hypothetical protein
VVGSFAIPDLPRSDLLVNQAHAIVAIAARTLDALRRDTGGFILAPCSSTFILIKK